MTERKQQNSLLVLATLGVYLGLVLVGATPQVLAQAAMTREFSVKDEIEVKDDLDTKPDNDEAIRGFANAVSDIYRTVKPLALADLGKVNGGWYDFDYFVTVKHDGSSRNYSPSVFNTGPRISPGQQSTVLLGLYDAFLPRSDEWTEEFLVSFSLTTYVTSLQATISGGCDFDAAPVAAFYLASLNKRKELETDVLRSLIYSNTHIFVENNHVVVVTRLPRGSIDPLIAPNANRG